jgi:hypothetical protein
MTGLSQHGRKLISESIAEHTEHFDSTPIHNAVYDADDGDDLITELALAAERAYYADKEASRRDRDRDYSGPIRTATNEAYCELRDAVQARIAELVAETCADVLNHADEWGGHYDSDELQASKQQARDWLDDHEDVAKRVGVLEVADA